MDEQAEQHEQDLDRAIDAARHGRTGADAGELGDTVERLHQFTVSGPPLAAIRIRRSIEGGIDATPQERDWWRPSWPKTPSLGVAGQKLATGLAVTGIMVAAGVASLLGTSTSASAAFLENVQTLADVTETATADGTIDDDESAAIKTLIEALHIDANNESLNQLDDADLANAALLLATINETLDGHAVETDALGDVTEAVVSVLAIERADTVNPDGQSEREARSERDSNNDDDDDDGDDLGTPEATAEAAASDEIAAATELLVQLRADVDQLELEADQTLVELLAHLADLKVKIAAAETETLNQVADREASSRFDSRSNGELDAREERDEDRDRRNAEVVDDVFGDLESELRDLVKGFDRTVKEIDNEAKASLRPFSGEFPSARQDAKVLVKELRQHLKSLEAEAKLAQIELDALLKSARASVELKIDPSEEQAQADKRRDGRNADNEDANLDRTKRESQDQDDRDRSRDDDKSDREQRDDDRDDDRGDDEDDEHADGGGEA